MKLKELKSILYSTHGGIQWATLWSTTTGEDIINGCSVDYAVKNYPEALVVRILAIDDTLVFEIAD